MRDSYELHEKELINKISQDISMLSLKLLNKKEIHDETIGQYLEIVENQLKNAKYIVKQLSK